MQISFVFSSGDGEKEAHADTNQRTIGLLKVLAMRTRSGMRVVIYVGYSVLFNFTASQSLNQFHRLCIRHFIEAYLRFALGKIHRV